MAKVFRPRSNNMPLRKEVEAEHRINEFIRVPEIRLVGDNLEEISTINAIVPPLTAGVYKTSEARVWADKAELDLIEITPNANPPVCKILDYAKFLYQKKKREKEIKSNAVKTVVKEIRFTAETGEHDIDFKVRHAIEFLGEGARVRAYVQFKGRGITFKDRGNLVLLRFLEALTDHGIPESMPIMEGKRMTVNILPKKKK